MPPIGFLEKHFSKKINDFLEKLPAMNNLGSIVFLRGQKKEKEHLELGFGTDRSLYFKGATSLPQITIIYV